jgi:FKBP-type peptidyl-prolyl cis-trans isomerase 2
MLKSAVLVIAMVLVLVSSGCVRDREDSDLNIIDDNDDSMSIKEGDTVKVSYEGKLEDGTVFDSTEKHGGNPLEFVVGAGQMISGFDNAVVGMKKGEEKVIRLEPSEAYGEHNPQLVQILPKTNVPEETKVGDVLGMMMPNGQQMPAKVIRVTEENITVDLNPELAGKVLIFTIKLLDFSS